MQKECIKLKFDFKLLVQESHASLYANTCLLGQFDEKLNHMEVLKLVAREMIFLLNHLVSF